MLLNRSFLPTFHAFATATGVSTCTTQKRTPAWRAMHHISYRYPLMPLFASRIMTGPSLCTERSTVAFNNDRVFFSDRASR